MAAEGFLAVLADEDAVEAGVGSAFVPIEKDAVLEVVIDPELAEGGFPFAGLEATDGGFVNLDVVGLAQAGGDELVEWPQAVGKVVVPGAHEIAGESDAIISYIYLSNFIPRSLEAVAQVDAVGEHG